MKGSGGKTRGTQAARTPGETRGDKRPPSTPGAFTSGYPSPMRSAAYRGEGKPRAWGSAQARARRMSERSPNNEKQEQQM